MQNAKTVSILNGLIETCKDGYEGFKTARDAVKTDHLKSLFAQLSEERAQCASRLQTEVAKHGEKPETHGSVAASMHRGWIGLKGAVTGGDESAIIAECERGEDSAMSEFKKALSDTELDSSARAVVQEVFTKVKAAHDRVRALEVKLSR